jgi:hydroxymethylpyrimidine/phosphomethylpyrimidine kinase
MINTFLFSHIRSSRSPFIFPKKCFSLVFMAAAPAIPICLSIAGSDPSGGAGLQADLKVFHQLQTFGMALPTLLTVQNSLGVSKVRVLDAEFVCEQLDALIADFTLSAIKLGALGSEEIIESLCKILSKLKIPIIADPVIRSSSGADFLNQKGLDKFTKLLMPRVYLLTPNLLEACALSKRSVESISDMKRAAEQLSKLGAKNVLITGGHLLNQCTDILLTENGFTELSHPKLDSKQTHGTGCVFSAAITAFTAKGLPIEPAAKKAQDFVSQAIQTAQNIGQGQGPMNLLVKSPE